MAKDEEKSDTLINNNWVYGLNVDEKQIANKEHLQRMARRIMLEFYYGHLQGKSR